MNQKLFINMAILNKLGETAIGEKLWKVKELTMSSNAAFWTLTQ
jgi:hypothetical protein